MIKQQHYKAALYCRLSVDDGNYGGSVSIETQKVLLEQYCKDHSITDYTFYCDDGCSGTNFDREAFRQMYTDIQNGKINLVIVKDLSASEETMLKRECMYASLPRTISGS